MIIPMCLAYYVTNLTQQWTLPPEYDYRKPLNAENVEQVLNLIRPSMQSDGGDCKFICLDKSTVTIELMGNCTNCPMKNKTVKNGIESSLNRYILSDDPIKVIIQKNIDETENS